MVVCKSGFCFIHFFFFFLLSLFLDVMVATLQMPGTSGPMKGWFLEVSMTLTLVSFVCETPHNGTQVWCLQF